MRSPPAPLPVAEHAHQAAAPEPPGPLAKVVRQGIENRRPEAVAQRKLAEFVRNSPRVAAQAKRAAALRGESVQRTGPEEEMLQGKFATVQRTGAEEVELLPGKLAPAQLKAGPGREPVHRMPHGPEEEDETLQLKSDPGAAGSGREKPDGPANRTGLQGKHRAKVSDWPACPVEIRPP
jgi:hypothetical protein